MQQRCSLLFRSPRDWALGGLRSMQVGDVLPASTPNPRSRQPVKPARDRRCRGNGTVAYAPAAAPLTPEPMQFNPSTCSSADGLIVSRPALAARGRPLRSTARSSSASSSLRACHPQVRDHVEVERRQRHRGNRTRAEFALCIHAAGRFIDSFACADARRRWRVRSYRVDDDVRPAAPGSRLPPAAV